jgi:hypothetical protein
MITAEQVLYSIIVKTPRTTKNDAVSFLQRTRTLFNRSTDVGRECFVAMHAALHDLPENAPHACGHTRSSPQVRPKKPSLCRQCAKVFLLATAQRVMQNPDDGDQMSMMFATMLLDNSECVLTAHTLHRFVVNHPSLRRSLIALNALVDALITDSTTA